MAQVKIGDIVRLMIPFKVFRIYEDTGLIDICTNGGDCITVHPNQILITDKATSMKAMKDAVLTVATALAKANNTVTTLEIKVELRRDYPYYYWTQDVVSDFMNQLAGDGVFTFTDNGTHRIYSLVGAPVATLTKTVLAGPTTANTVSNTATGVTVKKTKVGWNKVLQLAVSPQFTSFILANGTAIDRNAIRAQKKSPLGYVTPKVGKVKSVIVGTTQYNVK